MNLKLTALGASVVIAGSALAADVTVNAFPPMFAPASESPAVERPMRAPLNPGLGKGAEVFGYTTDDRERDKHYVKFYSTTPGSLDKINTLAIPGLTNYDDEYGFRIGGLGGVMTSDGYYAYRIFYYDLGYMMLMDWVKVDTETGASKVAHVWDHDGGGKLPAWFAYPQALVSNPTKADEVYAFAQSSQGTVTSALYSVDKATGNYKKKVIELPKYYFAAAYNYDNQIYAITWKYNEDEIVTGAILDILDPEDNFDVVSSTEILVDGKSFPINYNHSMAVDHSTGDIYWAAYNTVGEAYFIKIDPDSKTAQNIGRMGWSEQLGGLYVPYMTAEKRTAPARVNDPSFTVDPAGANKVTLNWTNPTTLWNRRAMTNLASVEIYRDAYPGTPVGTVTATGKEGQAMSFTDEGASTGVHTYYIVAVNSNGKGVPAKIDAFVGKDVPGPVQNLTAVTPEGKTIKLTWEKPAVGDSDGWYDSSDLTYYIRRITDGVDLGSTKELTFTDTTIGDATIYTYEVYATNAQGKGTVVTSEGVLAGNAVLTPFTTDFMTKIDADRFISIDRNGDGTRFEYDHNNDLRRNTYVLRLTKYDNDDILVSPAIKVEKDKTYKVVYTIRLTGLSWSTVREDIPHPIRIVGGTEPTDAGMKDLFVDDKDHTNNWPATAETYVAYFKAPITGEYYIGFEEMTSNLDEVWFYLEGFHIEQAPENDLQAAALKCYPYLSTLDDNHFEVEVYNNGDNDQSKYTVKLVTVDPMFKTTTVIETSDVTALKSHESVVIPFDVKMPELGTFDLYAEVVLAGDGNEDNNRTEPMKVQAEEVMPLNYVVDDNTTHNDDISNIPFNHNSPATLSQTIYTPAMTLLNRAEFEEGITPKLHRIAWEGNSLSDFADFDDTRLSVYVAQTDEGGYVSDDRQFIPVESEALFDDYVTIKNGYNLVVANFDEPFEFNPKRPICVTVGKYAKTGGTFLIGWKQFDADWYAIQMHTLLYSGTSPIDATAPQGEPLIYAGAPVVHLGIEGLKKGTGISDLVVTGNGAVLYHPATGTVESEGFAIAAVQVYDLAGNLLKTVNGRGSNSVPVSLEKGLNLIKVTSTDGKTVTLKTQF